MCILFLYVAKQASRPGHGYKLILAANRDEFYSRPARPARFWDSDPNILAGQDLESGGTWLGLNSKTGKIGALLNIMGGTAAEPKSPKASRGSIITNFLRAPSNLSGWTYCRNLSQEVDPSFDIWDFNQFNFLTIDLFPPRNQENDGSSFFPSLTYFTNAPETRRTNQFPVILNSGPSETETFGFGNSILSKPFRKVCEGLEAFTRITRAPKAKLKTELIQFLKSTQRYFPDPQLEAQGQGRPQALLEASSSLYLQIPQVNYGTRTHTLLLIDSENQVDFHEWTMEEPIRPYGPPNWIESNYEFKLP